MSCNGGGEREREEREEREKSERTACFLFLSFFNVIIGNFAQGRIYSFKAVKSDHLRDELSGDVNGLLRRQLA